MSEYDFLEAQIRNLTDYLNKLETLVIHFENGLRYLGKISAIAAENDTHNHAYGTVDNLQQISEISRNLVSKITNAAEVDNLANYTGDLQQVSHSSEAALKGVNAFRTASLMLTNSATAALRMVEETINKAKEEIPLVKEEIRSKKEEMHRMVDNTTQN